MDPSSFSQSAMNLTLSKSPTRKSPYFLVRSKLSPTGNLRNFDIQIKNQNHMHQLTVFGSAGEWFNVDPEAIISQALQTGAGPNVSDAYTINGLPGPLYNCSSKGEIYIFFVTALFQLNFESTRTNLLTLW